MDRDVNLVCGGLTKESFWPQVRGGSEGCLMGMGAAFWRGTLRTPPLPYAPWPLHNMMHHTQPKLTNKKKSFALTLPAHLQ